MCKIAYYCVCTFLSARADEKEIEKEWHYTPTYYIVNKK